MKLLLAALALAVQSAPGASQQQHISWEEVRRQIGRRVDYDLRGMERPKRYSPRRP